MTPSKFESLMESKHSRFLTNEDKAWEKYCKLADKAEHLIGELCREGNTVHYINLRKGKTLEGNKAELTQYLIRNNYV